VESLGFNVAELNLHDPGGALQLSPELMNNVIEAMSRSTGNEAAAWPEIERASCRGGSCTSAASASTSASLGVASMSASAPSPLLDPRPPSAGELPLPQLGRARYGSPTTSPMVGDDDEQQHDETRIRKAQQLLANMLSPGPLRARSSAKRRRRRQHSAPASAEEHADSEAAQTTSKRASSMTPLPVGAGEPPLQALNGMMPRFPTAQLQTPEQCARKSRSRSAGRVVGQGVTVGPGSTCGAAAGAAGRAAGAAAAVVGWGRAAVH